MVDTEQKVDGRACAGWLRAFPPRAAQHDAKGGAYGLDTPPADPSDRGQASVEGGRFQRFQCVDVEGVVYGLGQPGADSGHCLEQMLRVQGAAQSLELPPSSRGDDLGDCRRDPLADVGQGGQPLVSFGGENLLDITRQGLQRRGRPAVRLHAERVRPLQFQEFRHLLESSGDLLVDRMRSHSGDSIPISAS